MGAYTGLKNSLDKSLVDYAKELNYKEENIVILNGDEAELEKNYHPVFDNLKSCGHHSDRRTPFEYGQDLVASWVFEDIFLKKMEENGVEIEHHGADAEREILQSQRTTASSDYKVVTENGLTRTVELVNDYTDFWVKNEKLHLRDKKYETLKNSKSILVAIALTKNGKKFAVIDFGKDVKHTYIRSHRPYGGKPAYEVYLQSGDFKDFSWEAIAEEIKNFD